MVKLQEVEDEHFTEKSATTKDNALLEDDDSDADYTDTDSEISSVSSSTDSPSTSESLAARLSALVDIVPPSTRARISSTTDTLTSYTKSTVGFGGNLLWWASTSIILLAIPFSLAVAQEQEIEAQEREQRMLGEGASQMLQSGSAGPPDGSEPQGGQAGKPAL
ncbi:MAG: hypothetical protein Q9160_002289 [Pyrenula sp. 1 TL-2023]